MTMAALLILALAAIGVFYLKRVGRSGARDKKPAQTTAQPYASVEIRCGKNACADAEGLIGQKLLAARAPSLPFPRCDAASCSCRYMKIDDRREESRRSVDYGIEPRIFDGNERRVDGSRRRG